MRAQRCPPRGQAELILVLQAAQRRNQFKADFASHPNRITVSFVVDGDSLAVPAGFSERDVISSSHTLPRYAACWPERASHQSECICWRRVGS